MVGASSFWLIFLGVNLIVHDKYEGFFLIYSNFPKNYPQKHWVGFDEHKNSENNNQNFTFIITTKLVDTPLGLSSCNGVKNLINF
jgi:hypothetical protein